jgi:hypothetical protein
MSSIPVDSIEGNSQERRETSDFVVEWQEPVSGRMEWRDPADPLSLETLEFKAQNPAIVGK